MEKNDSGCCIEGDSPEEVTPDGSCCLRDLSLRIGRRIFVDNLLNTCFFRRELINIFPKRGKFISILLKYKKSDNPDFCLLQVSSINRVLRNLTNESQRQMVCAGGMYDKLSLLGQPWASAHPWYSGQAAAAAGYSGFPSCGYGGLSTVGAGQPTAPVIAPEPIKPSGES